MKKLMMLVMTMMMIGCVIDEKEYFDRECYEPYTLDGWNSLLTFENWASQINHKEYEYLFFKEVVKCDCEVLNCTPKRCGWADDINLNNNKYYQELLKSHYDNYVLYNTYYHKTTVVIDQNDIDFDLQESGKFHVAYEHGFTIEEGVLCGEYGTQITFR